MSAHGGEEGTGGRKAGANPAGYLSMPVGEFVAALSEASPSPAGGSTAALTVTLAAGLCVMVAGLSTRQLPAATQLAAEARRLRDLAAPLAQADAEAYGAVLAARRRSPGEPVGAQPAGSSTANPAPGNRNPAAGEARRARVGAALARASEIPLEVARIGAGVAELAARLAADGNPAVRGDAVAAALLAAAAARTSAVLVGINAADQPGGHGLAPTERPAHTQRRALAESAAQAESSAQAELSSQAESAVQAGCPTQAERVVQAERVADPERVAQRGGVVLGEPVAPAELVARAERYACDAERYAREAASRQ